MPRAFHVYIMASASRRLYIGVTANLLRRVHQHQAMELEGFTRRYRMVRLVYVEATQDVKDAIRREQQIKGWIREKKLRLIESLNPEWRDLAEDLLGNRAGAESERSFAALRMTTRGRRHLVRGEDDNSSPLSS